MNDDLRTFLTDIVEMSGCNDHAWLTRHANSFLTLNEMTTAITPANIAALVKELPFPHEQVQSVVARIGIDEARRCLYIVAAAGFSVSFLHLALDLADKRGDGS
jgi:hypothetical protein